MWNLQGWWTPKSVGLFHELQFWHPVFLGILGVLNSDFPPQRLNGASVFCCIKTHKSTQMQQAENRSYTEYLGYARHFVLRPSSSAWFCLDLRWTLNEQVNRESFEIQLVKSPHRSDTCLFHIKLISCQAWRSLNPTILRNQTKLDMNMFPFPQGKSALPLLFKQ